MNEMNRKCAVAGRIIAAAAFATVLAGCVGAGVEETVLPVRIDYRCAGNKILQVQRATDAQSAAVLIDGKPVILSRAGSAAQEKYSDGNYELYLDGTRAMLEHSGRVLFGPCTATAPLPTTVRERY